MPARESPVRAHSVRQRVHFRDRDPKPGLAHGAVEALELVYPCLGIVCLHGDSTPLPRGWLDAIRMSDPTAAAERGQALRETLAADECQDRVESVGCERARNGLNVGALTVHDQICSKLANKRDAVLAGRGRKHARAASSRELHGETPD
jgi:hypothetical protein